MGRRSAMKQVASLSGRPKIDENAAKAVAAELKTKFPDLANLQMPPNQTPNEELLFLLRHFLEVHPSPQKQDIETIANSFAKFAQTDISEDIVTALQFHATFGCLGPSKKKKKVETRQGGQVQEQVAQQVVTASPERYAIVAPPLPNDPTVVVETVAAVQQQPTEAKPPTPEGLPPPKRFTPSTYVDDILFNPWLMFSGLVVTPNDEQKNIADDNSDADVWSSSSSSGSSADSESEAEEVKQEENNQATTPPPFPPPPEGQARISLIDFGDEEVVPVEEESSNVAAVEGEKPVTQAVRVEADNNPPQPSDTSEDSSSNSDSSAANSNEGQEN